jgi:peptidoglycan/LPS O-acetylase OafA/YrhL
MIAISIWVVIGMQIFCVLCGYLLGRIHENEKLARKARR